jgi:hypothetical protein
LALFSFNFGTNCAPTIHLQTVESSNAALRKRVEVVLDMAVATVSSLSESFFSVSLQASDEQGAKSKQLEDLHGMDQKAKHGSSEDDGADKMNDKMTDGPLSPSPQPPVADVVSGGSTAGVAGSADGSMVVNEGNENGEAMLEVHN